jgi:hypothetical protein
MAKVDAMKRGSEYADKPKKDPCISDSTRTHVDFCNLTLSGCCKACMNCEQGPRQTTLRLDTVSSAIVEAGTPRTQKEEDGAMRLIRHILILAVVLCHVTAFTAWAEPTEQQVKAAFVYNFFKYVDWPTSALPASEPAISLCVLGQDNLADALESLSAKTVQERKIAVKKVSRMADAEHCQALYVGKSVKEPIPSVVKGVKEGVLTVSDLPGFASAGGMINFIVVETRISFEVNVDAAERAGLKISSQMLKVGKIVKVGGRKE